MRHKWHECDTGEIQVLQERHKCDTNENIFSHRYVAYVPNDRLQVKEKFHSRELPFENASHPCQNVFQKVHHKNLTL